MTCEICGGSGWAITERPDGMSGAERCRCSIRSRAPSIRRPPTDQDFAEAVQTMHGMIPFFPRKPEIHLRIAAELSMFIDDKSTLDAFVRAACMERWEGLGPVFRRFERLRERDYARSEMEENARRIESYHGMRDTKALPVAEEIQPAGKIRHATERVTVRRGGASRCTLDRLRETEGLPTREEVRKLEHALTHAERRPTRTAEQNKQIEDALKRELEGRASKRTNESE